MFQFWTAVSQCGRCLILETTPMICCPCVCVLWRLLLSMCFSLEIAPESLFVLETTPRVSCCFAMFVCSWWVRLLLDLVLLCHVCLFMMSETAPRSRLHDVHVNALPPKPIRRRLLPAMCGLRLTYSEQACKSCYPSCKPAHCYMWIQIGEVRWRVLPILGTCSKRGTQIHAEKLFKFVLISLLDLIGDQKVVQHLSVFVNILSMFGISGTAPTYGTVHVAP